MLTAFKAQKRAFGPLLFFVWHPFWREALPAWMPCGLIPGDSLLQCAVASAAVKP
jgi:hypothetical protein